MPDYADAPVWHSFIGRFFTICYRIRIRGKSKMINHDDTKTRKDAKKNFRVFSAAGGCFREKILFIEKGIVSI